MEQLTPSPAILFSTWAIDPSALVLLLLAAAAYGAAVIAVRRRGHAWPLARVLGFFIVGLGSYAVVSFGFLGVYSQDLRWAFTTRIALLLFAVPGLCNIGAPLALVRLVLSGARLAALERVLHAWPVRIIGSAGFAPIFALVAFSLFLTPLAGSLRESPLAQGVISVVVPLIGLLMVIPVIDKNLHSGFFITVEFLFVFVELILDAIPGIMLRINDVIYDHVASQQGSLPSWFPGALRDQHLSGDLLWFIAEISDIPVLIYLFVRWSRIDRREAKSLDDLSDEEMAQLTEEHLRANRR